jgi:uncharacterized membrane protein
MKYKIKMKKRVSVISICIIVVLFPVIISILVYGFLSEILKLSKEDKKK